MKKYLKFIIPGIAVVGLIISGFFLTTLSDSKENAKNEVEDIEKLEDNSFYVTSGSGYQKAGIKDYTFEGNEINKDSSDNRAIFFDIESENIPTVSGNEVLLYTSKTEVPEEFIFERFRDDGVSIGLANLVKDESNHYYFPLSDNDSDDYKGYVDMKSEVSNVTKLTDVTRLYIDQVGGLKVNPDSVTAGGVIKGLEPNKSYVGTFYTGTNYQDFRVDSNIHTFTSMEEMKAYDYEFMHSNVIKVKIPEYFKSGYYLVNGIGFIRYIAEKDIGNANIDYNSPMIIYDEYGFVVYDPSDESYKGMTEEQAVANSKVGIAEEGV